VSAAATRDDLASVVQALTGSAKEQRRWQAEYEAKAAAQFRLSNENDEDPLLSAQHRANQALWERFAAQARGSATAYEVSADMLKRYVTGASHD
jgi:hypothetical protein